MFSHLSGGTRNAPSFDQAARTVACITELLNRANCRPSQMTSLAFIVIAPEAQIKDGVFSRKLEKSSIGVKVQERAKAFSAELSEWVDNWFSPTLEYLRIETLSWESLINIMSSKDMAASQSIQVFYDRCLLHNRSITRRVH